MKKSIIKSLFIFLILGFILPISSCSNKEDEEMIESLNKRIEELEQDINDKDEKIDELEKDIANYILENKENEEKTTAYISSSICDYSSSVKFKWDFNYMLEDANVYNNDVAMVCLLVSINAMDECLVKTSEAIDYPDNYNDIFEYYLGFTDVLEFHVESIDSIDELDTTNLLICHRQIDRNNEVVMVSYLGTDGNDEWISNFDMGNDSSEYLNATGNHPDWINYSEHKGFSIAAYRSKKVISDYVDEYVSTNKKVHFLFTGYSRGAAVANIIGSYYKNNVFDFDFEYDSRTYTFATPTTTCSDNTSEYDCIFNFVNSDDVVTILPPTKAGFKRYGKDISFSIKETELEERFEEITKSYYQTENYNVSYINEVLNVIISSRDELYKAGNDEYNIYIGKYDTLEEASENRNALYDKLTSDGLDDYTSLSKVYQSGSSYCFKFNFSNGFIVELVSNNLDSLLDGDYEDLLYYYTFINNKKYNSAKVLIGIFDSTSMVNAHYPTPYILYVDSLGNK